VKTYAKRLGLVGILVAAVLAVASYATIAGGSMQGMDHGTGEEADRGATDHGSANKDAEGASGAVAPAEAGVEIQVRVEPASPASGEPTELAYRVSDAESGPKAARSSPSCRSITSGRCT